MSREDDWTSTVDGAAGHAAQYAPEPYDDRPTAADLQGEETISAMLVRRRAEARRAAREWQ